MKYRLLLPLLTILCFSIFAFLRWPGAMPLGNDTDEHLLVAKTFLETGHFSVGDLHATRFPPLVSSLLVLLSLLNITPYAFIFLNLSLYLLAVLILQHCVNGESGTWAGVWAGLYFASSIYVWESVHLITGDILLLFLITAGLLVSLHVQRANRYSLFLVLVLAGAAVSAKAAGLVLAAPLALGVFFRDNGARGKRLLGASAVLFLPIILLVLFWISQSKYPEHPTNYKSVFLQVDPYDLSKGFLDFEQALDRTLGSGVSFGKDLLQALTSPSCSGLFGFAVALGLLACGCLRPLRESLILLVFIIGYSALLILWPYNAPRLAIPFVPIAAIGIAKIAKSSQMLGNRIVTAMFSLLLVSHLISCGITLEKYGEISRSHRKLLQSNLEELQQWVFKEIDPDEVIASFDYRELTLNLGRTVIPLPYTSEVEDHLETLNENRVSWLIVSSAYFYLRGQYAQAIIDALGDSVQLEFENYSFKGYRIGESLE